MPVDVDGTQYFSTDDVADAAPVSRQTLWRWRPDGSVPSGHRYRGKHLIFTADELRQIVEYAHRLEPATVIRDTGPEPSPA